VRERLFISRHRVWQIATDAALVSLAFWLAFLLRFDFEIPPRYAELLATVFWYVVVVKMATFFFSGLYNKWWRYAGIRDLASLLQATVIASALAVVVAEIVARYTQALPPVHGQVVYVSIPRGVIFLDWMLTFLLMGGARLASRTLWERPWRHELSRDRKKVLVVGAGDAGELVVREMLKSREIRYRPVGFVDDDPRKKNLRIHGVRVVGTTRHLTQLVDEYAAQEVIIAIPSASGIAIENIVLRCKKANVPVKTLPGVYELIKGSVTIEQLREVQVEDILGRGEVEVDLKSLAAYLDGRRVLVTGAGGSIGSELCRQIAAMAPSLLLLVDHAEHNLFAIHHELVTERGFTACLPLVADVKNAAKVEEILAAHRPQIVFHAAAYKHVPLMEANPVEAFDNNTFATRGLARAAADHRVQRFVNISTDKAVEPKTVMGLSKALGERIIESVASTTRETKFMTVRFGNVLGSSGSVVPIFKRQIAAGGPVTVTDERMTRFFMTIPEAVRLVMQAGALGRGGEIFVLDMGEPVRVIDLAREMIRLSGLEPDRDIEIQIVGLRPGEKLHEKLFNDGETVGVTIHPKITRAMRTPLTLSDLDAALDTVQAALRDGDIELACGRAQEIVAPVPPLTRPGTVVTGDGVAEDDAGGGARPAAAAAADGFARPPEGPAASL
jgi:FlaA1/EpsC-like NDP-sugar epimerase